MRSADEGKEKSALQKGFNERKGEDKKIQGAGQTASTPRKKKRTTAGREQGRNASEQILEWIRKSRGGDRNPKSNVRIQKTKKGEQNGRRGK